MPPPFKHQQHMADFAVEHARVLNGSDPGTGKTRGTLMGYQARRQAGLAGRMLVVAPLSILQPAWGDDTEKFTGFTYAIAHGKREQAFVHQADIVMINHDGIKWFTQKKGRGLVMIPERAELLEGFTDLVIDEFTAYKHRTSERSRAMKLVSLQGFDHISMLSGTANPNTVLDLWHPAFILDNGKRLGQRFFHFRSQVCTPEQQGPLPEHVRWVDKPGAGELVADALADVTIRYKLEECTDIPENTLRYMYVDMPLAVMKAYKKMENDSTWSSGKGQVTAVNAAARATKLLQILSGAVYDQSGNIHPVDNARYDLVMQLVDERPHSLVAFNWKHQRDALCEAAERNGYMYAVIDGKVSAKARADAVERFQAGDYRVLFCHPQSASHGLTLTRGTTTIWTSPTHNAEHFKQFNQRIYRTGQTKRTETICIAARGTREQEVYENSLNPKLLRMEELLDLLSAITKAA